MPSVEAKLRRLRGWFIAYYVIASVIADLVMVGLLGWTRGTTAAGYGTCAAGPAVLVPAVLGELVVLALFLWFFHALLRFKDWARTVLLVFAWLGILSALVSTLSMGGLPAAQRCLPGVDLARLATIGLVTNALNLLLWGYVLKTLQFDREVKAAFAGGEPGQPAPTA